VVYERYSGVLIIDQGLWRNALKTHCLGCIMGQEAGYWTTIQSRRWFSPILSNNGIMFRPSDKNTAFHNEERAKPWWPIKIGCLSLMAGFGVTWRMRHLFSKGPKLSKCVGQKLQGMRPRRGLDGVGWAINLFWATNVVCGKYRLHQFYWFVPTDSKAFLIDGWYESR